MHVYSVPIGPSHATSQIDTPNANAATHIYLQVLKWEIERPGSTFFGTKVTGKLLCSHKGYKSLPTKRAKTARLQ